jgi:GT2 family glycosyltransferase
MDVLVVDDASPDYRDPPQLRRIAKRHCRRRRWGYLRTPRSLGFGGAINWALARIRTDADFLLFMHDDAALQPDALEKMVARLESDRRSAILGPKIVSWDEPERLEEVGMAVDRFGYPYKGLERGEIDLGQHDHPSEVFFVTSTCMLMRHEVFQELNGWDAQMGAFSEDLDLCWRARLAGHSVRVEPTAKARHAIALATGMRPSQFTPARYYIRRNRLRSVVKNASSARLFLLLPQFVLLALAEMLGFIVLRQYGEILNIARALGWNLMHAPQTLAARFRVQRARNVADRSLKRLTVRETTRLRAYMGHQAERLEEAWGRRAELLSNRATRMRAARRRFAGWPGAVAAAVVLVLLIGGRNYLWAAPVSVGQLLPFPDDATAVLGAYMAPWRDAALGQPGPAPPALVALGVFPLVAFGLEGLAQKLLIVAFVCLSGVGAHRLMGDLVPLPGRWVAASIYVLGGVAYVGLRQGSLATLAIGAAMPFGLRALLRITAWTRPAAYDPGAEIARLAIAAGFAAAFAPGALVLFLGAGVLLALARGLVSWASCVGAIGGVAAGSGGGWLLLLPWSATWFTPGGPLEMVAAQAEAGGLFGSAGMIDVLLGQVPRVSGLAGFAPLVPATLALVVATGQRRRVALALWLLVAASGVVLELAARGMVPAFVASSGEAGVLPNLCLALLSGVAVGACMLELPRRRLGVWQALALGTLGLSLLLLFAGLLPAVWEGRWEPGRGSAGSQEVVQRVEAVLEAEAASEGRFRALWIGGSWFPPRPPGTAGPGHVLSGPSGPLIGEIFADESSAGAIALQEAIAAIEQGATDRGGRLLGAFNVRFVVLGRNAPAGAWLRQRDFGVVRSESEYSLLENHADLPRGGIYGALPAGASLRPQRLATAATAELEESLEPRGPARLELQGARGPAVAWLAENRSPGWRARLGDRDLAAREGVWGNAFRVPGGFRDELELSHPRTAGDYFWYAVVGVAWLAALGAATARRTPGRARREGSGGG